MPYPEAVAHIQALCKVVLDAAEENGYEKGKIHGYVEAIKDYRKMQEDSADGYEHIPKSERGTMNILSTSMNKKDPVKETCST